VIHGASPCVLRLDNSVLNSKGKFKGEAA
jgi:hypothetical protein